MDTASPPEPIGRPLPPPASVSAGVWIDMKPMRFARRLPPRFAFWALAGVALLASHDAIWLAQAGPGESLTAALRRGGHGYWEAASAILAAAGVAVALWAAIRLLWLGRRASGRGGEIPGVARPYVARAGRAWLALFVVVAIGFVIQENLEHALTHGHRPGLGALLGPEYPLALPVIGVITLLGALAAAAFVTAEHILLARLGAVLRRPRAPRPILRPARKLFLPCRVGRRAHAGRGPPALLVAA